jgi:signal transduction histidine kinase
VFTGALSLVLLVMLFFTLKVLDYERAGDEAAQRAALEENVHLALWRMDSTAATLVAERQAKSKPADRSVWNTSSNPANAKQQPPATTQSAATQPVARQQALARQTGESRQAQQQSYGSTVNSDDFLFSSQTQQTAANAYGTRIAEWRDNANSQAILIQDYTNRATLNTSPEPVVDWEKFAPDLLARVQDIFPDATLVAATQPASAEKVDPRMLATIPARMVIKEDSMRPAPLPWNTPIRISLIVAWASAAAAALAVGLLLKGVLDLSDRRAAFVSTVTHELRTPLTTFRMYSEMLADGMVQSPEAQKQYLDTLVAEADRLGHLIENVLAYARLERQLSPKEARTLTVAELLERSVPGLERRVKQGGYGLRIQIPEDVQPLTCRIDTIAVHQILLNLVDNACKYAKTDITLTAARCGPFLHLAVSDTGPGLDPAQAARLFTAFSKSRDDAVPGIGLGLYLSRRLARQLGGDLVLSASAGGHATACGASFVFSIPLSQTPNAASETSNI